METIGVQETTGDPNEAEDRQHKSQTQVHIIYCVRY